MQQHLVCFFRFYRRGGTGERTLRRVMALLPVRALPRPNPAAAGAIPGAICWFRGSFWSKTSRATAVSRVEPLPVPLCGPAELLPGCWSLRLLVGPV